MEVSEIIKYADKLCLGVLTDLIDKDCGKSLIVDLRTLTAVGEVSENDFEKMNLHLQTVLRKMDRHPSKNLEDE